MSQLHLENHRFGRLLVKDQIDERIRGNVCWNCVCDCGNTCIAVGAKLVNGSKQSCGCLAHEPSLTTTHGLSNTPEYRIWGSIIQRCDNAKSPAYHHYGGRGIQICQQWRSFENFYNAMGPRPTPDHSIDRFPDQNGNYEPGNCRWATPVEQGSNTNRTRVYEHQSQKYTAPELAQLYGIDNLKTFATRLSNGWDVQRAITQPIISR